MSAASGAMCAGGTGADRLQTSQHSAPAASGSDAGSTCWCLARLFSAERGRHGATVWYCSQLALCLSTFGTIFSAERGRHGTTVWYSSQLTLCLSTFGTLPRANCHAAPLTIRTHVCLMLQSARLTCGEKQRCFSAIWCASSKCSRVCLQVGWARPCRRPGNVCFIAMPIQSQADFSMSQSMRSIMKQSQPSDSCSRTQAEHQHLARRHDEHARTNLGAFIMDCPCLLCWLHRGPWGSARSLCSLRLCSLLYCCAAPACLVFAVRSQ